MTTSANDDAIATLAGGCFWCLETAFNRLRGVHDAISGYMGGESERPSYEQVCGGRSGHAEVVQVRFDPDEISYRDLLECFFDLHDPTTLNRQGNDVGSQYRSAIFWHSPEQRAEAEAVIAELTARGVFPSGIVTQVVEAATFWPAEAYHQRYFEQNPGQPYCRAVVGPKVAKFSLRHAERLKQSA
ncbi:MAG: peptide-methionine (S)-S-oxide reductase MsrA [Pseudomonadota bacterium]|nr:peptide-methionine (S)-S-oxide reductase MsrA [Pseudomonadota bacterium]MDP1572994.1 peptide-methionine (S)-S-oxide reductase MsrA [Pseudomonadota bacterium]MDP1903152.1 peptide-methionine (S)-S-oxide reductase MsrA [Pseudomonadota bacterium]